jgi:hypothetical protein
MVMAEVVPSEIESKRRLQVLPLLGESVSQARQSANLHPHREILPFNVRGTNPIQFGFSPNWDWDCIDYFGGRVPCFSIMGRGIDFYQLREVNASSKAILNGIHIGPESICRDLKVALSCLIDLLSESHSITRRSASKMPSHNDLAVTLDGNETVSISAHRVAIDIVLFLAPDVAPNFIALDIAHGQCVDSVFEKPFALLTYLNKQGKNRGVVKAGNALNGTDRASLDKKLYSLACFVQGRVHAAKRCGVIFCEGLSALNTAIALKAVAVLSKLPAFRLAIVTGHFGLPFCGSKPIMDLRSALRLTPRADLAPSSVSADGGAYFLSPHTKAERSAFLAALNLATLNKPMQNSVDEREGILNILKVVSPILKRFSNLNSTDLLTWRIAVKGSAHKVCPCNLRLYLLPKSVLKADFRGLKLRDLYIQLISLLNFSGNLSIHFLQCLLENLCHISTSISRYEMIRLGVTSCQAKC